MPDWVRFAAIGVATVAAACGDSTSIAQTEHIEDSNLPIKESARSSDYIGEFAQEPMVFMWQVQSDAPDGDFAYLADQGVSVVMAFRLVTWPDDVVTAYLDGADRAGLTVSAYLGLFRTGEASDCHFSPEGIDFVKRFKSHPAISMWHTIDEPAEHNVGKDCQRNLYRTVKKLDPNRPILMSTNNNTPNKYRKYFTEDAFDILEFHKYVNPEPGLKEEIMLQTFKMFRSSDYPLILTLRAFNSPHKERRIDMVPGSLKTQYQFFIRDPGLTRHFGFYGWDLAPNKGIKAIPELKQEFEDLMKEFRAAH